MTMTEVFVANGPHEAEVFGVYEELVAGREVDLVFVEGYAAQSPGTASSFPAYRWFVVAYDLLDRFGVQVYYVDTSVVLALMGGAHYGAGDYFWEPFHAILCSVFVRQRIIHTRPERRAEPASTSEGSDRSPLPDAISWDQPHNPTAPTAGPRSPRPPARARPKTPRANPRS